MLRPDTYIFCPSGRKWLPIFLGLLLAAAGLTILVHDYLQDSAQHGPWQATLHLLCFDDDLTSRCGQTTGPDANVSRVFRFARLQPDELSAELLRPGAGAVPDDMYGSFPTDLSPPSAWKCLPLAVDGNHDLLLHSSADLPPPVRPVSAARQTRLAPIRPVIPPPADSPGIPPANDYQTMYFQFTEGLTAVSTKGVSGRTLQCCDTIKYMYFNVLI